MTSNSKNGLGFQCQRPHLLILIIFILSTYFFVRLIWEIEKSNKWNYSLKEGETKETRPNLEIERIVKIGDVDPNDDYDQETSPDFDGLIMIPSIYGNFCVYENVLNEDQPKEQRITMILHSSFSYLDESLIDMAKAWDGHISMAVFIDSFPSDSDMRIIVSYISHLRNEIPEGKSIFTHLFYRRLDADDCRMVFLERKSLGSEINETIERRDVPFDPSSYPINVARNLGRLLAPKHEYFLVADMDQDDFCCVLPHFVAVFDGFLTITNKNLRPIQEEYSLEAEGKLRAIAESRNLSASKEVLVIRRFEHHLNSSSPRTVAELETRYGVDVNVFHEKYFSPAHMIPHLVQWFRRGDQSDKVEEVAYQSHYWEPMFVGSSRVPLHDETLRYQSMNHLALCWDLCVFGWKFLVVDGVFNTHRGMKLLKSTGYYKWPSKVLETEAREAAKVHREALRRDFPIEYERCLGDKRKKAYNSGGKSEK